MEPKRQVWALPWALRWRQVPEVGERQISTKEIAKRRKLRKLKNKQRRHMSIEPSIDPSRTVLILCEFGVVWTTANLLTDVET